MRREHAQACCYERLLKDVGCLKYTALEETDAPRLTQGYEGKHGVLAPVDVLKHTKWLKEPLAQGEEKQKRMRGGGGG